MTSLDCYCWGVGDGKFVSCDVFLPLDNSSSSSNNNQQQRSSGHSKLVSVLMHFIDQFAVVTKSDFIALYKQQQQQQSAAPSSSSPSSSSREAAVLLSPAEILRYHRGKSEVMIKLFQFVSHLLSKQLQQQQTAGAVSAVLETFFCSVSFHRLLLMSILAPAEVGFNLSDAHLGKRLAAVTSQLTARLVAYLSNSSSSSSSSRVRNQVQHILRQTFGKLLQQHGLVRGDDDHDEEGGSSNTGSGNQYNLTTLLDTLYSNTGGKQKQQ